MAPDLRLVRARGCRSQAQAQWTLVAWEGARHICRCVSLGRGWPVLPLCPCQGQQHVGSAFQNSKPDSLLKMEEEQKLEKCPLSGSRDSKFSFSFSNKKLLGYVSTYSGAGTHPQTHSKCTSHTCTLVLICSYITPMCASQTRTHHTQPGTHTIPMHSHHTQFTSYPCITITQVHITSYPCSHITPLDAPHTSQVHISCPYIQITPLHTHHT